MYKNQYCYIKTALLNLYNGNKNPKKERKGLGSIPNFIHLWDKEAALRCYVLSSRKSKAIFQIKIF